MSRLLELVPESELLELLPASVPLVEDDWLPDWLLELELELLPLELLLPECPTIVSSSKL